MSKSLKALAVVVLALSLVTTSCSSHSEKAEGKGFQADVLKPILSPAPAPSSENDDLIPAGPLAIPGDHEVFATDGASPDRRPVTSEPQVKPEGFTQPPTGEGMARYYRQVVDWKPCDGSSSRLCATVKAPLDWQNLDGEAITLSVMKSVPDGESKGAIFVNPGGPGGSGLDFVSTLEDSSLGESFEIIGWDPRGGGKSTPVSCGTGKEMERLLSADHSPDDEAEWQALVDAAKGFADACRRDSGALIDHISTLDTIQDLDMLRHLAGQRQLNYLGVSYGTYIGALYAEFYPKNVGRMVLDSAVNITEDDSITQFMGFELALNNWAEACAAKSEGCSVGKTKEEIVAKVDSVLQGLDAQPLKVGDRTLTQSLATSGLALLFYMGEPGYSMIEHAVSETTAGKGETLLVLSDLMFKRQPDGKYGTLYQSFYAIGCLDAVDEGIAKTRERYPSLKEASPVFAGNMGVDMVCPVWTAKPSPQIKITAKGAAPIVVLGITGDNATPVEHSEAMAKQLQSGVFVKVEGAGHGAYLSDNECAVRTVDNYLINGVIPQDGTKC